MTHDDNNYVVDPEKCNFCLDCISPCPTGSIDNWRIVASAYSLQEQFSWSELPVQEQIEIETAAQSGGDVEASDDEAARLIAEAHLGAGGKSVAPASAGKPKINLFNRGAPALATVSGNFRLTDPNADNDVRHVILDFGGAVFPVLEGQSIGIVAPGADKDGKPHKIRLYSIASPREGEKSGANNLSLTVKREGDGVCSNYICDLKKGDQVQVTGPFGATFLMPDDPSANILMICTGTGSAPFRGFTERRRRNHKDAPGRMMLYFGARRPEELPYFGPLQKVPDGLLRKHFCLFARAGRAEDLCAGPHARDARRSRGISEERQDAHLSVRPEGHGNRRRRSLRRYLPQCRPRLGGVTRRDARAGPLSRRDVLRFECPVSVTNRTCARHRGRSVTDPKRTSRRPFRHPEQPAICERVPSQAPCQQFSSSLHSFKYKIVFHNSKN